MGLFDFFKKTVVCSLCRTDGAEKTFTVVRCRNPQCPRFDNKLPPAISIPARKPLAPPSGTFDAGPGKAILHYRNFQGLDRDYTVDKRSVHKINNHISVRAEPTGERIAFDRRFIANMSEVETWVEEKLPEPNARERQVLGYHKKYGTTSPLYEEIRKKYPDA